jgi:hypothetical protein
MVNKGIHINTIDEIESYIKYTSNPILLIVKKGSASSGFYGEVFKNIFGSIFGDETKGLRRIIRNFFDYEYKMGREPFVFILGGAIIDDEDMNIDNDDDKWVVHSTDKDALESIIKTGELLSRIELEKRGIKYLGFGREILNEPYDYYDLIEFGSINMQTEIIVASKEKKKFVTENEEYIPGGRIYIKKETLFEQTDYIEFLNHHCIKGHLHLNNVEYCIVTVKDFEIKGWTPKSFLEEANKLFQDRLANDKINGQ